jgi:RNA polymerase sigma-70 factor (ECF subfamily)
MKHNRDRSTQPAPEPSADQNSESLQIFDQYRGLLFSIAYRMLGSVADAEDMLQETFLRWQAVAMGEVHSPRAFLVTIISRLCLNQLQSARARREDYVGQWLPEPLITEPDVDRAGYGESLSMAFLVLLERLTPIERAVFLLHEVFEYEHAEIAETLGQSEANCRQILRRARQHISEMRARFRAPVEQRDELLRRFVHAATNGDLAELVAMLSRDAVLHSDGGGKAPAIPNLVHGADPVARAILGGLKKLVPPGLLSRMVKVNGSLGLVSYSHGQVFSVLTLDVADGQIAGVYIVTNPEKLSRLPALPPSPE